jgi:hypothetical protein
VLDIVVPQNIAVPDNIVFHVLDSDHLPIVTHLLDHVQNRNLSEPIQEFTDWELISPRIEINSVVEADLAARNFAASVASGFRLSTSKITLSDINNDLPSLDPFIKQKQRLRRLWQESRDPACKRAVNWVSKSIRRITRKKAIKWWETKICKCEVTPKSIWPIAKSFLKRDGPRAPNAIHGASGLKFHPSEKAKAITDCLEIQFTPHGFSEENHEQQWRLQFILYPKT